MTSPRRALLFIPVIAERFLAKAHERGADAVILDLEDSIPSGEKAQARQALGAAVLSLSGRGIEVWVRVNNDRTHLPADLAAAALLGVSGLMLPKIENLDVLHTVDRALTQLERARGLHEGSIRLCATLETPQGLPCRIRHRHGTAPERAGLRHRRPICSDACPPDLGLRPWAPRKWWLWLPPQRGLSLGDWRGRSPSLRDRQLYARSVALSKTLGLTTILCVHPRQVEIAAEAYRPTETEITWASDVVDAYDEAKQRGLGSINLNGRMVDEPIYRRAQSILNRSRTQAAS